MARLLVIDDDDAIRSGMVRFLRFCGHQVWEAADGDTALRLADREELDLVITDVIMPERDGIEVILALAEKRPGLPVIAISGGGRLPKAILLSNADDLGAVRTLPKPFDLVELRDAVAAALEPRSA